MIRVFTRNPPTRTSTDVTAVNPTDGRFSPTRPRRIGRTEPATIAPPQNSMLYGPLVISASAFRAGADPDARTDQTNPIIATDWITTASTVVVASLAIPSPLRRLSAASTSATAAADRKSTRLNSSHRTTAYAGRCLKNNTAE